MIAACLEWMAEKLEGLASRLRARADSMKARKLTGLVKKESLSQREAKELENLVENLPEVTVNRRS